ncbi:MAG: deoxyribodipyrimidine photo-lyase, partial [Bacteroidota bacterium]
EDNWALLYTLQLAQEKNTEAGIVFNVVPDFLEATLRQYDFMLKGLKETVDTSRQYSIPFYMLQGNPIETIPDFLKKHKTSALVCDFDPLRIKRVWKKEIARKLEVPFYEVDAHNIIPCLYACDKQEFAAYTLRPKIKKLLPDFLDAFPSMPEQKKLNFLEHKDIEWERIENNLNVNAEVKPVDGILPGTRAALDTLKVFLDEKLINYEKLRNDPTQDALSNLSPYLHFGQISAQRVAVEVTRLVGHDEPNASAFLEELIVRRELSDNFCYFNTDYDKVKGFHPWAIKTLDEHRKDEREHVYNQEIFEMAQTHDELWNAAQTEMVKNGKMHGYMRMYWAKKILEWSSSPEDALRIAIYLNDKYQLDGRDPNGYAGCAWSIGGVHDRAWTERPVFGKIRFMNFNGAKRKFDVKKYIKQHLDYDY